MIRRIVGFFGDRKYARPRRRLFYLVLVLIVVADFLVPREHVEFFWERRSLPSLRCSREPTARERFSARRS